jgi:hypothetical protein
LEDPETWRIVKNWAERNHGSRSKKAAVIAASVLGISVHDYQNWSESEAYFQGS